MLPKTVIDTTIVYTFDGCHNGAAKIKITPTLTARTLPDPLVGQLKVDTASLEAFWSDGNISIQTFPNSRILNSIGSSPTSQIGQIFGNIFGGVAKLAGITLGGAALAAEAAPLPTCVSDTTANSGPAIAKQIQELKDLITSAQLRLSRGEPEADEKKDNAAIQASQTLITTLDGKLTLTIKTTIDPGVTPVEVDADNKNPILPPPTKDSKVRADLLVASICPSRTQLAKANWFENLDQLFATNDACTAIPSLKVNIYLDFPNGHSTLFDQPIIPGPYTQSAVLADKQHYRDVAYIPVLVWRGDRPSPGSPAPKETDSEAPRQPFQLLASQPMAFGQFGVPQSLPFTIDAFKTLTWQITFLEDGEITAATFSSHASGVNVSSFLGTAASTANSIAADQKSAPSPSAQASAIQGQADLIYQTERLHACQTSPANCPSK
jgi:hypothetical protein